MEETKKIERKCKRFKARLQCSKGILFSEHPQTNLIILNAGQATGLAKSNIKELAEKLNIICPKYVAEKGESHSYLVFTDKNDCKLFHDKCNGKALKNNGIPLYLNYIEKVPDNEILCSHGIPKGLYILNDFITLEEESKFLEVFDFCEDNSNLKNRQVKHYGYEFRYGSNDVDLKIPLQEKIPSVCDILWARLKNHGFNLKTPDQLTVNKYSPGQGIPSHVDRHSPFGDIILSLSLGSSVVMDWRHHSAKFVPVVLPARSLLVMKGEARYDWKHGIQPRTWDPNIETRTVISENVSKTVQVITNESIPRQTRISLTFRWTRSGPCECSYKTLCDSVVKSSADDIEDELASNLENIHVHQVYEQIAGHFSSTRHKPWPRVVKFMQHVDCGAVVLDLGCGNGKNILNRSNILQIAGERSNSLLKECQQLLIDIPTAECVRLDLLHPGLRDECADAIICIAVIHHFSSKNRRLQAVQVISRLLKSNGRALITVWAKDQTKSNYLSKTKNQSFTEEVRVSIGAINLPVHENRTQFQHTDLLVPWKLRKINDKKLSNTSDSTLLRYYHVFEENELSDLCLETDELIVEDSFYEEGNWCVVCRKK